MKRLQDHVKATIAPYKYPRSVKFVDALPKTQTGKIQRFQTAPAEAGVSGVRFQRQDADRSVSSLDIGLKLSLLVRPPMIPTKGEHASVATRAFTP